VEQPAGNKTLMAYTESLAGVEDADTVDEALNALERSADVFATFAVALGLADEAVYATASDLFTDFRKRAYRRVAALPV